MPVFKRWKRHRYSERAEPESRLRRRGSALGVPVDGWSQPVNLSERFGAGLQRRSVGSLKEVL